MSPPESFPEVVLGCGLLFPRGKAECCSCIIEGLGQQHLFAALFTTAEYGANPGVQQQRDGKGACAHAHSGSFQR